MALTITLTAAITFYLTVTLVVYGLITRERLNTTLKESFFLFIFSLLWLPLIFLVATQSE